MPKLTIDDIEFNTEDLSKNAKDQLLSLQFLEGQMKRHTQEMAVYKTAHGTYLSALKKELLKKK
ncbi:DUF6447 family protein [Amylibacter sp.]|jgi:hypothetical protein|nr:DUF6447 family protein [Amylibacter sp.]